MMDISDKWIEIFDMSKITNNDGKEITHTWSHTHPAVEEYKEKLKHLCIWSPIFRLGQTDHKPSIPEFV